MKKPIMERVAERVEAYKKANPLSKEQILSMSLYDYYNDLNSRFFKEIAAEEKAAEEAKIGEEEKNIRERNSEHINSMLREFKDACTIGYCLEQWKGNNGSQYEKWQGKKGTVIIEIYAGGAGFETYKQSPDPDLNSTIDFINS